MPLGVLGGVDQQSEHCGRQLETANAARFEQRRLWGGAELREGAVDLPLEAQNERGCFVRRRSGLRLALQKGPLFWREPLAPGIGEQPVEAAGGMADVEAH